MATKQLIECDLRRDGCELSVVELLLVLREQRRYELADGRHGAAYCTQRSIVLAAFRRDNSQIVRSWRRVARRMRARSW